MTRLLTLRETADMLGVHRNTVIRSCPSLPFFRVVERGDRRYRLADVEAFIEARMVRGGLR